MCDHHDGLTVVFMQIFQHAHDLPSGVGIEISGRFVGKQYLWAVHQRTGNRDSLALPAAQLVRLAGKFKSKIKLTRTDNEVTADAKSILSVLTLAAGKGTELDLSIEGDDEQAAFSAIEQLISNGFGEI